MIIRVANRKPGDIIKLASGEECMVYKVEGSKVTVFSGNIHNLTGKPENLFETVPCIVWKLKPLERQENTNEQSKKNDSHINTCS